MRTLNALTSSVCRNCRFYEPEGRRGGQCQQLGVPVCGHWNSCSLAIPPFAPSWESLDRVISWQDRAIALEETFSLEDEKTVYPVVTASEQSASVIPEKQLPDILLAS